MTVSRRALIISNPGETGAENYCNGANLDVDLYRGFLTSPLGGAWRANEINALKRPSVSEVRSAIAATRNTDYSMVVFSGHGYYSKAKESTILELKAGVELDSLELREGSTRRTIILDCCRVVHAPMALDEMMKRAIAKADSEIDPAESRYYFDKEITNCPSGVAGLFGCLINQTAGDDPQQGGFYSTSLVKAAATWARDKTDTSKSYYKLTVVGASNQATPRVNQLSGGTQTPIVQKPRSEPYFPFAIVA